MTLPTKEELGAKLLEYPLLRQLLYERWFRIAFAGFALVFVFLALFLPKIWRTSDAGFRPVVRVSGLDLVQAWSLKRTALKAQAAGKYEEAQYAWQAALANNRADAELARGAVRNVLMDPRGRERRGQAIQEAYWLLRLTGTNMVDLQLASRVLERFRYYDPILQWLEPRVSELTPELRATYLKALFNEHRFDTFNSRWMEFADQLPKDPDLELHRAAYLAGWGPPETAREAREKLELATAEPGQRVLAQRLKLAVAAQELNLTEYARALKGLEEAREDNLQDHARYWRLLVQSGRREDAAELARSYPRPPGSATELVELAQVYAEVGLVEQALGLFEGHTRQFGHAPVFWVAYATVLLDLKRWDALRNLALQIRSEDDVRDALAGFSHFLEGRAEQALGREGNAVAAYKKAAEREYGFPTIGQRVAAQLLHLGQPDIAIQILGRLEKPLERESSYWTLLFSAAEQVKDGELMLKAAAKAYGLNARDPIVNNNYAAALLITRQAPDQAIKLTLPFLVQNPQLPHAIVNHGAALLLNGRAAEAQRLLEHVPTNRFNRTQLTLYNLDLFELYLQLGRKELALAASERIEPDRLYPTQRDWFLKHRGQVAGADSREPGARQD